MKEGDLMSKRKQAHAFNAMKSGAINGNFKNTTSHGKGRAVAKHSTKNK